MAPDPELLRQFLTQRDQAAFRQLVDRHLPAVYSAALRQVAGDRHLAQDVSQRVFTALAAKARSVAGKPSVAGWLCKAARYEAAHAVREAQRRRAREWEAHPELMGPAEIQAEWERLRPVIDEVLCAMAEEDREVVLLRFFHNLAYPEIGARLGKSADAVRLRADRALGKMKKRLQRAGIDSTSAAIALALANRTEAAPAEMAGQIAAAASRALAGKLTLGAGAATAGVGAGFAASALALGLALLGGTFAWREYPLVVQARHDAAAAKAGEAAQTQALANWQSQVAGGKAEAEKAEAKLAALKRKLGLTEQTKIRSALTPAQEKAKDAVLAGLAKDPAIRRDFEAFWSSAETGHYAPFLRAHGFTEDEIAHFISMDIHQAGYGISDVSVDYGQDTESSESVGRSLRKLSKADLRALYENDEARSFAEATAGALADSPDALSGDQGQRLAALIARHTPPAPRDQNQDNPLQRVDWTAVQSEAQNFLSPHQQEILADESALGAAGSSFRFPFPGGVGNFGDP